MPFYRKKRKLWDTFWNLEASQWFSNAYKRFLGNKKHFSEPVTNAVGRGYIDLSTRIKGDGSCSIDVRAWLTGSVWGGALSGPRPCCHIISFSFTQTECDSVQPGMFLSKLSFLPYDLLLFLLQNEFYKYNINLYIELYHAATLIYCKWWLWCNVFICLLQWRIMCKGKFLP